MFAKSLMHTICTESKLSRCCKFYLPTSSFTCIFLGNIFLWPLAYFFVTKVVAATVNSSRDHFHLDGKAQRVSIMRLEVLDVKC